MAHTAFDPAEQPEPTHGPPSPPVHLGDVGGEGPDGGDRGQLVHEVARRAAIPTWVEAAAAARATLRALGGWLDAGLRADIAAHLPHDLATAVTGAPHRSGGDVVALYRRAAAEAGEDTSLHEVALRCAAVLAVLGESLPAALVQRLAAELPADISALVAIPDRAR